MFDGGSRTGDGEEVWPWPWTAPTCLCVVVGGRGCRYEPGAEVEF